MTKKKKVNGRDAAASLLQFGAVERIPTGVEIGGRELYVRELTYGEQSDINKMRQRKKNPITDEEVGLRGLATALVFDDGSQVFEDFEAAADNFHATSARKLILLLDRMNEVNNPQVTEELEKNALAPDSSNSSAGLPLN